MRTKKVWGTGFPIQLSLRLFIKRSRRAIAHLEEPFHRTDNPMGYAILAGIILGFLIFVLFSGKNLFGSMY